MPTTVTFFPVDNGDMTLIRLGDVDSTTILIDVNIRVMRTTRTARSGTSRKTCAGS